MGKSSRPISKDKSLDLATRRALKRKPEGVAITSEEHGLMRRAGHAPAALYIELAWLCDPETGVVPCPTYDSLRKYLLDDDLVPVGRAFLRICLLELDDVGLIEFDRTTPTKRSPVLGITVPHQRYR